MCVALLFTVQHSLALRLSGEEGRHEAKATSVLTARGLRRSNGLEYKTKADPHTLVKRDMFSDFEVPPAQWEVQTDLKNPQPVMEDRLLLLQAFLFNQAMNTRHPAPVQEEKVVRCFRVPKTQKCSKPQYGAWEECEVTFSRECYLYTYIQ